MEEIKAICREIVAEAEAIMNYTDDMAAADDDVVSHFFESLRIDELEHIQKLTITLSEKIVTNTEAGGEATNGDPEIEQGGTT